MTDSDRRKAPGLRLGGLRLGPAFYCNTAVHLWCEFGDATKLAKLVRDGVPLTDNARQLIAAILDGTEKPRRGRKKKHPALRVIENARGYRAAETFRTLRLAMNRDEARELAAKLAGMCPRRLDDYLAKMVNPSRKK